ncbi:SRPBCC domain-containing protein [bacterium SCSIO 12643]|nr:SRPBCC domain-containing protein [bacterium SCSIO 12643]
MKTIETQITIPASIAQVWSVLMDHTSYQNWNPFISNISGLVHPGSTLEVTIHPEEDKSMNFSPIVLKNNAYQEFRWKGKLWMQGIFDGEHYFILKPNGNQTQFIHGEHFTGILSGLLFKLIGKNTQNGFRAMNQALYKEVLKRMS